MNLFVQLTWCRTLLATGVAMALVAASPAQALLQSRGGDGSAPGLGTGGSGGHIGPDGHGTTGGDSANPSGGGGGGGPGAAGGRGGGGAAAGGRGGDHGTADDPIGAAGRDGGSVPGTTGGGGGGGGHGYLGQDIPSAALIAGGNGGAGAATGAGGAGGYGAFIVDGDSATVSAEQTLRGGRGGTAGWNGGDGGYGLYFSGDHLIQHGTVEGGRAGEGARGGVGLAFSGSSLVNTGTVSGGNGYDAGEGGAGIRFVGEQLINEGEIAGGRGAADSWSSVRDGGRGGAGLVFTGNTLINEGSISGADGHRNSGGVGVLAQGDGATVINAGHMGAGRNNAGSRNDALRLTGDQATLELRPGYSFHGNVVGSGNDTTLALAGLDTFDLGDLGSLYRGFRYLVHRSGDTSLIGSDSTGSDWHIEQGILRVGADSLRGNAQIDADALLVFENPQGAYNGVLSGAGGISLQGAGHLTLTGQHTYSGSTTVESGTLVVDGALTHSAVTLQQGTLQSNGLVAGLTVHDGVVMPGGDGPGTLTVDGDMWLGAGAQLDYRLGQPGPADDPASGISGRIDVHGDLTLDGTLNLFAQDDLAGDDLLGYYRLMTWTGDLTDHGLNIGQAPTVDGGFLLLTGDNRLDLFVAALGDDTLQHWQGGDGVWSDTSEQWLNQDGELPVSWAGNHGVFMDAGEVSGGTVTVQGAQQIKGLQFVDDGYRLEGDGELVIDGAAENTPTEIRVLAERAEVATAITGSGGLDVTGGGTLSLSGLNTYTGGTRLAAGTLEVSQDANLGDASGALTFDGGSLRVLDSFSSARDMTLTQTGVLDVAEDSTLTLSGQISGAGGLLLRGGTVTFDGAQENTWSGLTTVAEGATLNLDRADAVQALGGDLRIDGGRVNANGAGQFSQHAEVLLQNSGVLHVAGDQQIGGLHGTNADSVIILDADLTLSGSGNYYYAGRFEGYGDFFDPRTVSITSGFHTFAGESDAMNGRLDHFRLDGGILGLASNRAIGGGTIEAVSDATVRFMANDLVLDNYLIFSSSAGLSIDTNGFDGTLAWGGCVCGGTLRKTGEGTLILSQTAAMTHGNTLVDQGMLVVDMDLRSPVEVLDGGRLGGNGAMRDTRIASGGILAPGQSVGTLTVNGDIAFEAGSRYEVDATPQGDSDLLRVTGQALIEGGSVLHVGPDGDFDPLSTYTILRADGGIQGTFDAVSSGFAFLDAALAYGDEDISLTLARNDVDFAAHAHTRNQRAAARAASSLGLGDSLYDAVLVLGEGDAPDAFESLSGDSLLAGLASHRYLLGAFAGELRQRSSGLGGRAAGGLEGTPVAATEAAGRHHGAWVQLHHHHHEEERDGDTGNPAFRYTGEALTLGLESDLDLAGEVLQTGAALGVHRGDLRLNDRAASGELSAVFIGAYARYQGSGAAYLRSDLSLGATDVDMQRHLPDTLPGERASASHRTLGTRLALEAGLDTMLTGLDLRPWGQVAAAHQRRSGFNESGTEASGLRVARSTQAWSEVSAGLDIGRAFLTAGRWSRLQGGVALTQAFGDTRAEQTARFQEGGDAFTVYGADHDGLQWRTTLEASLHVSDSVALHGGWRGHFSDHDSAHQAVLGLTARW